MARSPKQLQRREEEIRSAVEIADAAGGLLAIAGLAYTWFISFDTVSFLLGVGGVVLFAIARLLRYWKMEDEARED